MNRLLIYIGALSFFLYVGHQTGYAQVRIAGMVTDEDTKTGLPAVTIINKRNATGTLSSESGRFYIEAMPGDTLEFSMLSYMRKEVLAPAMSATINVSLTKRIFGLQEVNVKGRNYQRDSAAIRDEYGKYFNYKKPGAVDVLKTLPANPITALSYLVPSKARKRKEQFHEQLVYWEKEKYIDYRYSPEVVARMTKLDGAELDSFMLKYRPSSQFVHEANEYDFLLYIKRSFEEYQQSKGTLRKEDTTQTSR